MLALTTSNPLARPEPTNPRTLTGRGFFIAQNLATAPPLIPQPHPRPQPEPPQLQLAHLRNLYPKQKNSISSPQPARPAKAAKLAQLPRQSLCLYSTCNYYASASRVYTSCLTTSHQVINQQSLRSPLNISACAFPYTVVYSELALLWPAPC